MLRGEGLAKEELTRTELERETIREDSLAYLLVQVFAGELL